MYARTECKKRAGVLQAMPCRAPTFPAGAATPPQAQDLTFWLTLGGRPMPELPEPEEMRSSLSSGCTHGRQ